MEWKPLLLLTLWFSLGGIFNSGNHYAFLFSFSKVLLVVIYLVLIDSLGYELKFYGYLTFLLASLEAIFWLLPHLQIPIRDVFLKGNPFYSGVFLSTSLIWFVLLDKAEVQRPWRIIFSSLAILQMVALFFIQSRSVWLALSIVFPFLISRTQRKWFLIYFLLFLVCMLNYNFPAVLNYFKVNIYTESGRLLIWDIYLQSVKDHWVFGWGLGQYETAYLNNIVGGQAILKYNHVSPVAHNEAIQMMVAAGIPGLIFFIYYFVSRIKRPEFKQLTFNQKWSAGTMGMILIVSLFNFPFYLPFISILFVLALHNFQPVNSSKPQKSTSNVMKYFFGGLIGVIMAFLALDVISSQFSRRGKTELATDLFPINSRLWEERGNVSTSAEEKRMCLKNEIRWNKNDPFLYAKLFRQLIATQGDRSEIEKAINHAIDLAPRHAPFWVDRGLFYSLDRDFPQAEQSFKKAILLEPNSSVPYYELGRLLIKKGKMNEGQNLIRLSTYLKSKYQPQVEKSNYSSYLYQYPILK